MSKSAKAEQYARELDSARLRGDWLSDLPTQSGKSLPWSELIRKFTKHNPTRAGQSTLSPLLNHSCSNNTNPSYSTQLMLISQAPSSSSSWLCTTFWPNQTIPTSLIPSISSSALPRPTPLSSLPTSSLVRPASDGQLIALKSSPIRSSSSRETESRE